MEIRDDIVFIDHSIHSTYATCEEKGRLAYVEHLVPNEEAAPLVFGKAFHAGIATAYEHSSDPLDTRIDLACRAFFDEAKKGGNALPISSDSEKRSIERGVAIIAQYVRKWHNQDLFWRDITDSAGKPYVEVGFGLYFMDWRGRPVVYVGKMDRIRLYRADGNAYTWESKTTAWGAARYIAAHTKPNHQLTGYDWAAKELLGIRIAGAYLDAVHVSDRKIGGKFPDGVDPEKDFARADTKRSDVDIDEFLYDLKRKTTQFLDMKDSGQRRWHRNAPVACTMYNGCYYKELCASNLSPAILRNKFKKKEWHPWEKDTIQRLELTPEMVKNG